MRIPGAGDPDLGPRGTNENTALATGVTGPPLPAATCHVVTAASITRQRSGRDLAEPFQGFMGPASGAGADLPRPQSRHGTNSRGSM
jgi:hypothetical protein